jgi:hypothetical protein
MQVFPLAKKLADCVIPAEYGISPDFKLRIGHKIAKELIGKLLLDLDNVKAESFSADEDLMQRSADTPGLLSGAPDLSGVPAEMEDIVKGSDEDLFLHGQSCGEEVRHSCSFMMCRSRTCWCSVYLCLATHWRRHMFWHSFRALRPCC